MFAKETVRLAEPQILTIWLFTDKVCGALPRAQERRTLLPTGIPLPGGPVPTRNSPCSAQRGVVSAGLMG